MGTETNTMTEKQESRRDLLVLLGIFAFIGALALSGLTFGIVGVVFPMLGMAVIALLIMVVFSFG